MKKGKTQSGFKFEVDERVMDDMELIDALAEAQGEDPTQISVVVTKIFGKEQKKKLYDHLREDGYVSAKKVADTITEVFTIMGEDGKN